MSAANFSMTARPHPSRFLPLHDIPADLPIEQIEFPADSYMGANLCCGDSLLDTRQKLPITAGCSGYFQSGFWSVSTSCCDRSGLKSLPGI
jgi:hypothetical protein